MTPAVADARDRAPVAGAFLFLTVFGMYLFTLAPTVSFWDSGELIAAAYSLGVTHQPGYPFYCMTAKLFSFIPAGNIAYRANLMSAVLSALTVYVVYASILAIFRMRSDGGAPSGVSTVATAAGLACVVAATRLFWSQAVVSEVYAAGGLFTALSIYAWIKAADGTLGMDRYVALSGLLFGLGVVNHASHILYLPALALTWAGMRDERRGRAGVAQIATGVFFVLLGLSACIYLPVRSAAGPAINIGHPDTWANFIWVMKRDEYASGAQWLIRSAPALAGRVAGLGPAALLGLAVAAIPFYMLVKEDRRLYLPPLVFLAVYTAAISAQVSGADHELSYGLPAKFYIPALVAGAVVAGGFLRPAVVKLDPRRAGAAAAAVVCAAAIFLAVRNFGPNDCSKNYIASDYAANSLKSAGERGVLLTWGDNGVFPLWYMNVVERYRDDIVLVHTPLMTYGWYLADVDNMLGMKVGFMKGYYLGENVYRIIKAVTPARGFAYDYSATQYLKLDEKLLKLSGLVYYEGQGPHSDPWAYYVFRGVGDPSVYKGPMDRNIIEIYRYHARLSGRVPSALGERPEKREKSGVGLGERPDNEPLHPPVVGEQRP